MSQFRLAIAANHPAIAGSFVQLLATALGRVIESEPLTSLLALRARLRAGLLPRLVLVDCGLYGFDPAEGLAELHLDRPEARLIALTHRPDPAFEAELVRGGARAVLPWTCNPTLAGRVVEIVAAGSSYMSTAALLAVSGGPARVAESEAADILAPAPTAQQRLTECETAILAHIRRGESNRAIGDALGIDENRVKIHLRAIFRKTGARNRTEAAIKAVEPLRLVAPHSGHELRAIA